MDENYNSYLFRAFRYGEDSITRNVLDSMSANKKLAEPLFALANVLLEAIANGDLQSLQQSFEAISIIVYQWEKLCKNSIYPNLSIPISEETINSIKKLAPFIPEKEQEEFQEIISISPKEGQKVLTIDNFKWLLGIIIPIIFSFVLKYAPDSSQEEQLRLQREQNEIILRIAESLESGSDDNEFEKFLEFFDNRGIVSPESTDIVIVHQETAVEQINILDNTSQSVADSVDSDVQRKNESEGNHSQDSQN